jgi:hypothetical protein
MMVAFSSQLHHQNTSYDEKIVVSDVQKACKVVGFEMLHHNGITKTSTNFI